MKPRRALSGLLLLLGAVIALGAEPKDARMELVMPIAEPATVGGALRPDTMRASQTVGA